jgi:hypothetical protein
MEEGYLISLTPAAGGHYDDRLGIGRRAAFKCTLRTPFSVRKQVDIDGVTAHEGAAALAISGILEGQA